MPRHDHRPKADRHPKERQQKQPHRREKRPQIIVLSERPPGERGQRHSHDRQRSEDQRVRPPKPPRGDRSAGKRGPKTDKPNRPHHPHQTNLPRSARPSLQRPLGFQNQPPGPQQRVPEHQSNAREQSERRDKVERRPSEHPPLDLEALDKAPQDDTLSKRGDPGTREER